MTIFVDLMVHNIKWKYKPCITILGFRQICLWTYASLVLNTPGKEHIDKETKELIIL